MRARLTWYPDPDGKAVVSVVEVTPEELATLRSALDLPPEALVRAVAKIRTYNDHGSVVHMSFPLRMVSRITPSMPRPAQDAGTPVKGEEEKRDE